MWEFILVISVNSDMYIINQNKWSLTIFGGISKLLITLITDFAKMYITRRKSTYLQIRNNRDLNFWLCGFSQTEHFSYPDLLNFPLQNILTLWWEEGLIISVYSGKKRKKVKKTLGKFSSSGKVIKQSQIQRKYTRLGT